MAALNQTAGNVVVFGSPAIAHRTAGATITAGMPVYMDTTDSNKMKAAKANAAATSICYGIALNGASNGQPLAVLRAQDSVINLGATVAAGIVYCVSDAAAGAIVPSADLNTGDYTSILGVGINTTHIRLGINNSNVAQ